MVPFLAARPYSICAFGTQRCALGLDRGIAIEPGALVPSTPRYFSRGTSHLPGPGSVGLRDQLCHCLDLRVAVLQLLA